MKEPNPVIRQDVIQNAVAHQTEELEEKASSGANFASLFNSQLNHDLITWPRQYLEAYLDSDESGSVPLSPEQLQDVLEAAFDRNQALVVEFLAEINEGKSRRLCLVRLYRFRLFVYLTLSTLMSFSSTRPTGTT